MYQNITSHQEPLMVLGLMPVVQIGEIISFLRKSIGGQGQIVGTREKSKRAGKTATKNFLVPLSKDGENRAGNWNRC